MFYPIEFYSKMYSMIYDYIINFLLKNEDKGELDRILNKIEEKHQEQFIQICRDLRRECEDLAQKVREEIDRPQEINIRLNITSEIKIKEITDSNEPLYRLYQQFKNLDNEIKKLISNNLYKLAYICAYDKLSDFIEDKMLERIKLHDVIISKTLTKYHSLMTVTLLSTTPISNVESMLYRLIVEYCAEFPLLENKSFYKSLEDTISNKNDFCNKLSELHKDFSNKHKSNARHAYEYLYDLIINLGQHDAELSKVIEFLFETLINQKKIIEIIVYRLFVKNIGLPTILNIKIDEEEYDIITIIKEKEAGDPLIKLIEVTTGKITEEEITKRSKAKLTKLEELISLHLQSKDIIWLVPNDIQVCNVMSLYRFFDNPLEILNYFYR